MVQIVVPQSSTKSERLPTMNDFREYGHKLVDWVADYLESPERYPVLPTVQPNDVIDGLPARGPDRGESLDRIFDDFQRVILPLSKTSFLTAAVLTFAHTVGEFGVVLMIGGDIPGVTRTLSLSIFDQVQELNYRAANHTALWLIALSFAALLLVYFRLPQRRSTQLG